MKLITAEEVIALAFTDKNYLPGKILDSHIEIAQEGFLRPALGDTFYAELTAAPPAGDNATLVNSFLKRPLAWFVRYVILPEIMVHASNSGLQVVIPQGTASASDKQAGTLREQAKQNADILLGVAMRYIRDNSQLFPLYEYHETTRSTTVIKGGIIFSRRTPRAEPTSNPATTTVTTVQTGIFKTVDAVRALTAYSAGDLIFCLATNGIYEFDATSTATDDGDLVIAPTGLSAGRWLKSKELQMVNL